MSEVHCDREKYCNATKNCPIPKHIKDMMNRRYPEEFICPHGLFYKRNKK